MGFQANATASSTMNAAGRNALTTSLTIWGGYIICWLPNQILTIISVFGGTVDYRTWFYHFTMVMVFMNSCINPFIYFSTWFYHFTVVMVFMNSCINPFIYAAKYREFQTAIKRLLHREVHPGSQA